MSALIKPVLFVVLVIVSGVLIGSLAGGGLPSFDGFGGGEAEEVAAK